MPAFWPQGKVKEKIEKSARISNADSCYFDCLGWTETELKVAINKGEVHFSKSKPRQQPCPEYIIEVENPVQKTVWLNVRSCDSTFAVLNVYGSEDLEKKMCECK